MGMYWNEFNRSYVSMELDAVEQKSQDLNMEKSSFGSSQIKTFYHTIIGNQVGYIKELYK